MYSLHFRESLDPTTAQELDSLLAALRGFLSVSFDESGNFITQPRGFDFVPVGGILPYAGPTAPTGWLLCDGTAKNRVAYKPLFDVIGTTYGVGDGSTTFNLPDLRQRFPLGKSPSGTGATLGSSGGFIDHAHVVPSHTHPNVTSGVNSNSGETAATGSGVTRARDGHTHTLSDTLTDSGDGITSTSNPPYQVVNYIILTGVS